jgi:hypothetical protein
MVASWLTSLPGHFSHVKEPRYPLNTTLGGTHSWSEAPFYVYILFSVFVLKHIEYAVRILLRVSLFHTSRFTQRYDFNTLCILPTDRV